MCSDIGSSWSRYIWWKVENIIPFQLIASARAVNKNLLNMLPTFYAAILRLYVTVNDLFYENNTNLSLPHNVWFSRLFPFVDLKWCLAGVNNILDVPLEENHVDLIAVTE